jgi:hypothetical protein
MNRIFAYKLQVDVKLVLIGCMIQMISVSSTVAHMATSCLVQHVNQRASRIATFDDVFCSCTPHTCDWQPFGNMLLTKRH